MALYRVVLNSERFGLHTRGLGVYNVRPIRNGQSWSTHAEGRACDFGVPIRSVHGDRLYTALRDNAATLGVQQILWNTLAWRCDKGEKAASAGVAKLHADHVHVELNRHSAATLTRSAVEKALQVVGAGTVLVPDMAQILERGDQGQPVRALQELLNSTGLYEPLLRVDGDFGPATQAAVTAFQKQAPAVNNVAVTIDGISGPQTFTALEQHLENLETPAPEKLETEQEPERPPSLLKPVIAAEAVATAAMAATRIQNAVPTDSDKQEQERERIETVIADLYQEIAVWIRTSHTKQQ